MNRHVITVIISFLLSAVCYSQNWMAEWNASARLGGSAGQYMPFWARTGESGILPVTSAGQAVVGGSISGILHRGFHFEAGTSVAAALAMKPKHAMQDRAFLIDRLYVTGGWKMLHAEVGMRPRVKELGDLSLTGGNVMMTGNARNMPGVRLYSDWIYFDRKKRFAIRGDVSEYLMNDLRYVSDTRLHNKSIGIKIGIGSNVDIIGGFEHFAQWGGVSSEHGPQPDSFKDYLRVFFAREGSEDATWSDQVNAIGNHLGREYLRVVWRASAFTLTFQYDKPFEDGSGMRFQNLPDGVWSIGASFADRDAFVTDMMYEFVTTTWQSGPLHDRPATDEEMALQSPSSPYYGKVILMGNDDYFNNGEYRSGWTYYGRAIGLPVALQAVPSADGLSNGFVSNRVRAHHFAIKGNAASVPYVFKATCTRHFGRWSQPDDSMFTDRPLQFSLGLDADLACLTKDLPLYFTVGIYGDIGKVLPNSAGLVLKLNYRDLRKF